MKFIETSMAVVSPCVVVFTTLICFSPSGSHATFFYFRANGGKWYYYWISWRRLNVRVCYLCNEAIHEITLIINMRCETMLLLWRQRVCDCEIVWKFLFSTCAAENVLLAFVLNRIVDGERGKFLGVEWDKSCQGHLTTLKIRRVFSLRVSDSIEHVMFLFFSGDLEFAASGWEPSEGASKFTSIFVVVVDSLSLVMFNFDLFWR